MTTFGTGDHRLKANRVHRSRPDRQPADSCQFLSDLRVQVEEPRVRSVRRVTMESREGVTAAATALVAFEGAPPTTVELVEFRGMWRVVV